VPWLACLGISFLALAFCAFRREHWGRTCPFRPQWWHIGDLLMEGDFWVPGTSPMILSFPLSSIVEGGSGTVGLTNTVLEVEGATYPRPVLSVGLFWIDSTWVSFSSVTLSNWSCVSSSFSSSSCILYSNELFSVCKLFRSWICCFHPSLSFLYSM